MINIKNILKVLVIALFVCAWSGDVWAKAEDDGKRSAMNEQCRPACQKGEVCAGGKCVKESAKDTQVSGQGGVNSADFCSGNFGIFQDLVKTGKIIFNRLRDLIYVVAGFGIIAVAVGGFFGNLNWKWLGAIVISLVVIATAGELIVLMTGCETFGSTLITNTLTNNDTMTTAEYNDVAIDGSSGGRGGRIKWDDSMDVLKREDTASGDSGGGEELPNEGDLP